MPGDLFYAPILETSAPSISDKAMPMIVKGKILNPCPYVNASGSEMLISKRLKNGPEAEFSKAGIYGAGVLLKKFCSRNEAIGGEIISCPRVLRWQWSK